jgi:hypothetical protein
MVGRIAAIVVVSFVTHSAIADPAMSPPGTSPPIHAGAIRVTDTTNVRLGVAVNLPLGWYDARSIAGSLFVPVTGHQSLRLNVASWANNPFEIDKKIAALTGGDYESDYQGRTTDVGIAWQYYPRRTWDGLFVELGGLVRTKDLSEANLFDPIIGTDTKTVAARAMVGGSVLARDRVFLAAAVGISAGYEWGVGTTQEYEDSMKIPHDISRRAIAAEAFVRLGFVFDVAMSTTHVLPPTR